MAPLFESRGYCVFGLDYGHVYELPLLGGMNDLMISAKELSDFVDKVLSATGATKVDILGHSEGSTLPRIYLKYFNGAAKTGSIQYGTTLDGITIILKAAGLFNLLQDDLSLVCKACFQLVTGSSLLNDVNKGGDTYPEVKYLMLVSRADEFITPYTSGFLKTTGPNVFNVELQSLCPLDFPGHLEQLTDRWTILGHHLTHSYSGG
ncbi:hypothetical protein BGX26_010922 [Mortierella sp. AD094]|nr:hypothetical protein BGX26_010922 [Mortierella sp. AD094]